ncbi:hypothetical protein BDV19DRAFT_280484 [Aspergillus venezuelensis]
MDRREAQPTSELASDSGPPSHAGTNYFLRELSSYRARSVACETLLFSQAISRKKLGPSTGPPFALLEGPGTPVSFDFSAGAVTFYKSLHVVLLQQANSPSQSIFIGFLWRDRFNHQISPGHKLLGLFGCWPVAGVGESTGLESLEILVLKIFALSGVKGSYFYFFDADAGRPNPLRS